MNPCILFYCIIVLFLWSSDLTAQSPNKIRKKGADFFNKKEYREALQSFDQIKLKYTKDLDLKYKMGLSYFYIENMKEAKNYLTYYIENEKKPTPKAAYYLARIAHLSSNFSEAASYYKKYIHSLKEDTEERAVIKRYLLQCTYGARLAQQSSGAVVSNLGESINSEADDYRACFNTRYPDRFFYSSNRPNADSKKMDTNNTPNDYTGYYRPNIYMSELNGGAWGKSTPLSNRYNSKLGESIVGFFDNGYQIVYLKELDGSYTEVVVDNYDKEPLNVVVPFALGAGSNYWDGDHYFPSDSLAIFASNRPGGYGGKDLYYTRLEKNGKWSTATNLGPIINTIADDVSPFLTKDGRKLYFSSNNKASIGGFDIYSSTFDDETKKWSSPINEGIPINSTADDKDFWMDKDGMKAYFTSNRLGGIGGLDIYVAYYRQNLVAQLSTSTPKTFIEVLEITPTPSSVLDSLIATENNPNTTYIPNESAVSVDGTTYTIAPIYYNAQTGEIDGANTTIRTLTTLLKKHPNVTIQLLGHTNNTGNPINDLYLTSKQAELIAKQLIENGVRPNQIFIKGCGQNYPVAHNENFDETPNELSHKINTRIDILVDVPTNLQLDIQNTTPQVTAFMRAPAYSRFQKKLEGLSYQVKITHTSTLLQHPIFEANLQHFSTEKNASEIGLDYMVGLESTFVEANGIYNLAKGGFGFGNAQIIAYIDGKRIDKKEALKLVNTYPDLKRYLNYLLGEQTDDD